MTKRSSGSSCSSHKQVSSARLHQKSGFANSFGGYAKVNKGGGEFRMRPTDK